MRDMTWTGSLVRQNRTKQGKMCKSRGKIRIAKECDRKKKEGNRVQVCVCRDMPLSLFFVSLCEYVLMSDPHIHLHIHSYRISETGRQALQAFLRKKKQSHSTSVSACVPGAVRARLVRRHVTLSVSESRSWNRRRR